MSFTNLSIGRKYYVFSRVRKVCIIIDQFDSGTVEIGNIMSMEALNENIKENALPADIIHMTVGDYDSFLSQRRHLMAQMIEEYYKSL